MKRISELRELSEDRHHGLALARMAKKSVAGEGGLSLAEAWMEVDRKFRDELEPHFHIEESMIGPALESRGGRDLVERLLREHAELRRLAGPGLTRTTDVLLMFGELLDNHIRFEERELFEVVQNVLSAEELAAIASASQARHG